MKTNLLMATALCAVLAERPLATRWGEFSQLERQRLQLSAHGVCAAGDRVALGAGPWAAGVARATLEVER